MVNQEKLIIQLHSDLSLPNWFVTDPYYQLLGEVFHGHVEDLPGAADNREVMVIVPAEDVLLTTITLPKMSRARLAQAVPYALEEQLAADIEQLHFAFGDTVADGSLGVAVVAKEKMQQWLDQLTTWDIEAHRLIPFSMLLPVENGVWHMVVNHMAIIRTEEYHSYTCDKNNLNDFLNLALSSATEMPERIVIHHFAAEPISLSLKLPIPVEEITPKHNQMIVDLIPTIEKNEPINLLQGAFTTKKSRIPQLERLSKMAVYLAAAWIMLLVAYPTVSYWILKRRVDEFDAQIAKIYHNNFPQSTAIIDPQGRMQDKLQKIKEQIGENRLLLLLAYVGKSLANKENIKLARFDYQNNQLSLEINAASSNDIDKFSNDLLQQGLTVKQENASLIDSGIRATLVID